MTDTGIVKVGDFGLAKLAEPGGEESAADSQITVAGYNPGTPQYMAPETRTEGATIDRRADIFSLGVTFYEMLTGSVPQGVFPPPSQKVQVGVQLDEVVLKAMQSEPDLRYQQASEVKVDIERITSTRTEPGAEGSKSRSERNRVSLWIGIAAAAAILAMVAAFGRIGRRDASSDAQLSPVAAGGMPLPEASEKWEEMIEGGAWNWAMPVRLEGAVNSTEKHDTHPDLSADGLHLAFTLHGQSVISSRDSPGGEWSEPLWLNIDLHDDNGRQLAANRPTLSGDGSTIVFVSESSGLDLYQMTRDADGKYGNLRSLDAVNSSEDDNFPELSEDGLTLVFFSRRSSDHAEADLFRAHRSSVNEPFGPVSPLPSVASASLETHPRFLDGGRALLFVRDGRERKDEVWAAFRDSTEQEFGPPVFLGNLPGGVPAVVGWTLSEDLSTMILSQGSWGYPSMDLWISERVRKSAAPQVPGQADAAISERFP